LLIAGFHRSGTSALSHALQGAYFQLLRIKLIWPSCPACFVQSKVDVSALKDDLFVSTQPTHLDPGTVAVPGNQLD
jgi:hypothetical protein